MFNVNQFREMLFSQLGHLETEPEVIKLAEELRELSAFYHLTEEEYQTAVDESVSTLLVSVGENYFVESDEKLTPWFESYYKDLGVTRWDRYANYLQKKGFAPSVINAMKVSLFKITDLLGNPNGKNFKRKGLVVGDVQSGKTANYVGLMNLATDAKYKLIIVLTGTTNTLREQTQIRIEDGLGKNSQNPKGVSALLDIEYKNFMSPVYLTSRESDFTKRAVNSTGLSLEQTEVPIVIVTKKNSSALKNIYEWLVEYSKTKNHDHIDSSVLLIDDEADFASVNTKKEDDSPTSINSRIRMILELFTKSSYIGFTATPFANIFINPETNDEMYYGQDLFPRDYIYVLGESSEYIGVQRIFSAEADKAHLVVPLEVNEVNNYLPLKHKKDSPFTNLAPSMIHAINLFFMANVIRDLRGDVTSHRSMLLNLSMYTTMHQTIKDVVMQYVMKIQKEVRIYGKLPLKEALEKETICSLKQSFDEEYSSLEQGYSFQQILKNMNDSVYRIKVAIVNKDNKEVDYLLNDDEGERVIIIGGFALARGLTLEGLIISYYWRNSVMYDSLLQMGRWFGYRPNYSDLVRIFMSKKVKSDFEFIAMATDELKNDLEVNSKQGLTPRDFGIKVRTGQSGLIITARNKMRSGSKIIASANFSKEIIETLAASVQDDELNSKNISFITNFIEQHKNLISNNLNPSSKGVSRGLVGLDKAEVITFLKNYIPVYGSKFDSALIVEWLSANTSNILEKWDFSFIDSRDGTECFDYGNGINGKTSKRTMIKLKEQEGIYRNLNSRLGSPTDGKFGLNEEQYKIVLDRNKKNTIPQKNYFDSELNRRPIILIYSVIPYDSESELPLTNYPIPFISVGIPDLGIEKSTFVNYTVNKIYQTESFIEVEEE